MQRGAVIPAHPLALTATRKLDERRQRALTRYYLDAGAGGLAVGVHTTQFAIRQPKVGLYRPVLELAALTSSEWEARRASDRTRSIETRLGNGRGARLRRPVIRIAGVIGPTRQAVREAGIAADLGYHCGLLSLGALARAPDAALIAHVREVARVIPLMGFYLQPAVGGRTLSYAFWRRFVEIENVVAIKIAAFDRYATADVVRAVADAGRFSEIALYTGNDDSIVVDLLTVYPVAPGSRGAHRLPRSHRRRESPGVVRVRMVGGLLGHWAFWTRKAVALHRRLRRLIRGHPGIPIPRGLLGLAAQITDANGAIFDAANRFRGCLPGIHEVLRRQGLLRGRWCLDPHEELSPGQLDEIRRVCAAYPHLADDDFVRDRLDEWLR